MRILLPIIFTFCIINLHAQKSTKAPNLVYVDKQGVLRYTKNRQEASFYGVNYTTPFAYAYRAHKALGADLEKAIQNDVYHLARLGLDAFRVHVWDTEISDSLGNLLDNDHLRLFDFLVAELKKRNIKTIITPIAFWGNGYPERDERTPGFSRVYGKGRATVNDSAIKAQENYLVQFFHHVNPYTKLTYGDDRDVIAVELNNEPSHSGPKPGVTNYINRLAKAVKSTGWTKPLFYNISQGPFYADAVANSAVDGFSFQWYPSGLVANQALKGNILQNVDVYRIPFDTISAYHNKALMVYEFDAADVYQSYMYPAMARSFRGAGFQWATQFAYDPMALAYANTEYQTHYLNLAYMPSKSISMLIASEVFHKVPRKKSFGEYPADSSFDAFRVSYKNSLSEMNTDNKFYYSNTTTTSPSNVAKLVNIAGVGSSPIIQYEGSGAYFLDKVEEGVWRLEVMPDAVSIRDPFERASPKKEVTRVQWSTHPMKIMLVDLGQGFGILGVNDGNSFNGTATADNFKVKPGTYLLTRNGKSLSAGKGNIGVIGLNEFVAPQPFSNEIYVQHDPYTEVSAGKPATISARIVGLEDGGTVSLQVTRLGGPVVGGGSQRIIPMTKSGAADYTAIIPGDFLTPGVINYRIIIQKGTDYTLFPGNIKTNPFAWDNVSNETWKTYVAAENGRLEIYNPDVDRSAKFYSSLRRGFQQSYTTGLTPGHLILKLSASELSGDPVMGFQHFFGDKLRGRSEEAAPFDKLYIRARAAGTQPMKAKVTLINADNIALSTTITLTGNFSDIAVPIPDLVPDSSLLLPRPYPGFHPLWFRSSAISAGFLLKDAEKIEIIIGPGIPPSEYNKPYSLEVESIWLEK